MQESVEDLKHDEGAPDEVLDDPKVKADIEKARARIRDRKTSRSGKSAEDLLNLARERSQVDSRP